MTIPALLILDTETTGVDPATDRMIELGAVLFDAVLGVPIEARSFLLPSDDNAAEPINRIPAAAVREPWTIERQHVRPILEHLIRRGEKVRGETLLVAHSADFDRQWLEAPDAPLGRWICSYRDASWPRVPGETGSLSSIALAYDVGIVRAHRALEDCLTLAAVLARVHEIEHGLEAWIARALEPKTEVIACVSYADREKAKSAGFRWDPERKLWVRPVRVSQLAEYRGSLPFKTREAA